MKVCIIGLGYVGLPLAVRAAEVGHSVIGIDLNKQKMRLLRSGASYVEDVSDERLQAVTGDHRLNLCDKLLHSHAAFDVAVVTVPTPLRNGEPDLTYVLAAADALSEILLPGSAVVLESTTYPGTTEGIFRETLESRTTLRAGKDFHLGYSPERIDPGPLSPHTLENTPKLVSGTTPEALEIIQGFYDTIVDTTVPVSSPAVAEMTKVFENVQAYVGIALINEVSDLCRDLGIDVHEMVKASMTKGHSMIEWYPGPGVGGHCLPVDSLYLTWQAREVLGRPARLIEMADQINAGRPEQVIDKAVSMLGDRGLPLRQAKVLVMGLAYKPDVGDVRESPALPVVQGLVGRGVEVTVIDPLVEDWTETPVLSVEDLPSAVKDFDLVVVTTDHSVFDFDKVTREARLVLDTRNAVPRAQNVVPL